MEQAKFNTTKKHTIVYLMDGLGMGGAERLMVPILSNIDRNSFLARVVVLTNKHGNPVARDLAALGIPVDFIPVPNLRDLTALPRIVNYLCNVGANLVHTQLEYANIFGGWAAKRLKIPSVSTLHTIPPQKRKLKSRLRQEFEFFCLRHSFDMVIFVSNETRQFHMKTWRMSEQKTCTIYNGIDLTHFTQPLQVDRDAVFADLGIPPSATILTTVAVLREPKGIQYMIRALPEILAAYPDVYYLVVGIGRYESELRMEAERSGTGRVVFAGMRKDIPRLLSISNMFVLPTLTEALPTVLAEAMALRLPILATRVGGVPEMVEDGINGRLVPPADVQQLASACIEMLARQKTLSDMGRAGRKIVEERFDVHMQVGRLQDLYRRLIHVNG
jgi:glycosyltransferase involved in cell wall biosynthesis